MRIVFIGTGEIGLPALSMLAGSPEWQLVGVVSQPDKPAGRKQELLASAIKQFAIGCHVPVYQPVKIRDAAAIEQIKFLRPDVIVVMAYGQILPKTILELPRFACLNLHASLLPRHRGASPIQAAIESGDRETGITVMYMAEGLDTGDVLLQKSLRIGRRETGGSLHDRLASLAPSALGDALKLIEKGKAPREAQQNDLATYAGKLERENGLIDWSKPRHILERKIRAMNPWPTAFTMIEDKDGSKKKLKIFTVIQSRKNSGSPGQVLRVDRHGILVAAGEGGLLLREIQMEGKKRMKARDFLLGHSIQPGTILG